MKVLKWQRKTLTVKKFNRIYHSFISLGIGCVAFMWHPGSFFFCGRMCILEKKNNSGMIRHWD